MVVKKDETKLLIRHANHVWAPSEGCVTSHIDRPSDHGTGQPLAFWQERESEVQRRLSRSALLGSVETPNP